LTRIIEKKILPKWFKMIANGEKNFEIRLADFEISEGDLLILREWDPNRNEYTGRSITKKVKRVYKIPIAKYYNLNEIKKYGIYIIELT